MPLALNVISVFVQMALKFDPVRIASPVMVKSLLLGSAKVPKLAMPLVLTIHGAGMTSASSLP